MFAVNPSAEEEMIQYENKAEVKPAPFTVCGHERGFSHHNQNMYFVKSAVSSCLSVNHQMFPEFISRSLQRGHFCCKLDSYSHWCVDGSNSWVFQLLHGVSFKMKCFIVLVFLVTV